MSPGYTARSYWWNVTWRLRWDDGWVKHLLRGVTMAGDLLKQQLKRSPIWTKNRQRRQQLPVTGNSVHSSNRAFAGQSAEVSLKKKYRRPDSAGDNKTD